MKPLRNRRPTQPKHTVNPAGTRHTTFRSPPPHHTQLQPKVKARTHYPQPTLKPARTCHPSPSLLNLSLQWSQQESGVLHNLSLKCSHQEPAVLHNINLQRIQPSSPSLLNLSLQWSQQEPAVLPLPTQLKFQWIQQDPAALHNLSLLWNQQEPVILHNLSIKWKQRKPAVHPLPTQLQPTVKSARTLHPPPLCSTSAYREASKNLPSTPSLLNLSLQWSQQEPAVLPLPTQPQPTVNPASTRRPTSPQPTVKPARTRRSP